mmetsp:Transcript_13129/g.37778  ORF Transcript_13129/g.37778 Transcript_13129/m.37778 type:complete len:263 (+) Transcript_13129:2128-2916(+)
MQATRMRCSGCSACRTSADTRDLMTHMPATIGVAVASVGSIIADLMAGSATTIAAATIRGGISSTAAVGTPRGLPRSPLAAAAAATAAPRREARRHMAARRREVMAAATARRGAEAEVWRPGPRGEAAARSLAAGPRGTRRATRATASGMAATRPGTPAAAEDRRGTAPSPDAGALCVAALRPPAVPPTLRSGLPMRRMARSPTPRGTEAAPAAAPPVVPAAATVGTAVAERAAPLLENGGTRVPMRGEAARGAAVLMARRR